MTIPAILRLQRVVLLWAFLLLLGFAMVRTTLGFILRPISPKLALRIDPANAEVQASRAEQLLRENRGLPNQDAAEALARRALLRSPVSAAGARMLATIRDTAGDEAGALRLVRYAESVSRRDLPTELFLIQEAVARNDVPAALRHYDIALRTSEASRSLLFPVLIAAIGHQEIRTGLKPILLAHPLWAEAFLTESSQKASDLHALADLLTSLSSAGYTLADTVVATSIQRITEQGKFDLAARLFRSRHPDFRRDQFRDPAFAHLGEASTLFDWQRLDVDGITAEPLHEGAAGGLYIHASVGSSGRIARQLLVLPSGTYRLGAKFAALEGNGKVRLVMSCAGSGDRLAEADYPAAAGQMVPVVVPGSCPAEWVEIAVDSGEDPTGYSARLGGLSISHSSADLQLPTRREASGRAN